MKRLVPALVIAAALFVPSHSSAAGDGLLEPSGTYMFAQRDTCNLYMDVYEPAEGSVREIGGVTKPTVLFMFGGGFKEGTRNAGHYNKWFSMLTGDGYRVVSIDYRLGLKDARKVGVAQSGLVSDAIEIAVEDLFSATCFLVDNAASLGIDPAAIVISGSSAGAISVMQGQWEACNRSERAAVLPEGFRYAGVMSFAGAIFSKQGRVRYEEEPAPVMMLHGTSDKIVRYGQIWFFNLRFAGAGVLVKTFEKGGYNYNILRFKDRGHEIASSMVDNYAEEIRFLETNVMRGEKRIVDAMVDDPSIKRFKGAVKAKDLYKD